MIGPDLIVAFVAGVALGVFHFGSLWWVTQRIPDARHPGVLILASFIVRAAITLTGLFVVSFGRWERIAACIVGFLLARTVLVHLLGPGSDPTGVKEG